MIIVLKRITAPQLNIILQIVELCKIAIGVGQRSAHFRIVVELPTHK